MGCLDHWSRHPCSFFKAFFSILDTYDLDMPRSLAVSFWVMGGALPRPYLRLMIFCSLSVRSFVIQEGRADRWSQCIILSRGLIPPSLMISMMTISLPSLSVPIGSYRDTSLAVFFRIRSIINSSLSIHLAA